MVNSGGGGCRRRVSWDEGFADNSVFQKRQSDPHGVGIGAGPEGCRV